MLYNEQAIHDALTKALKPEFFQLENESSRHSRPGDDTHYKVTLVSSYFDNLKPIERHRLVNQLCEQAFHHGLHALSLHLFSPMEWEQKTNSPPRSPACNNRIFDVTKTDVEAT